MSILCYIARFDEHPKFWPHFTEFYAENKARHQLALDYDYRTALHKGQNRAIVKARSHDFSHILFVEDDHWGFPVDGLDALLGANTEVIGLHTFVRELPAMSVAMRKKKGYENVSLTSDQIQLTPVEYRSGFHLVQDVDLIGFGMTLIRLDVFDRLRENPFAYWGNKATDSQFCQACLDVGIRPKVHFGATLGHGDVSPDTRMLYQKLYSYKQLRELRSQKNAAGEDNPDINEIARKNFLVYRGSDGAGEAIIERVSTGTPRTEDADSKTPGSLVANQEAPSRACAE